MRGCRVGNRTAGEGDGDGQLVPSAGRAVPGAGRVGHRLPTGVVQVGAGQHDPESADQGHDPGEVLAVGEDHQGQRANKEARTEE